MTLEEYSHRYGEPGRRYRDNMIIRINRVGIENTLTSLEMAGKRNLECVVLWLAEKQGDFLDIRNVYLPEQTASIESFHISRNSMEMLLKFLRENRLRVAAQVHTHPELAFHSHADDQWAIVRHVGALSLVLPYFARGVTPENFADCAAVYRLNEKNNWSETASHESSYYYRISL